MKAFEESIKLPSDFEVMDPGKKAILLNQQRNILGTAMTEFYVAYWGLGSTDEYIDGASDGAFLRNVVDGQADLIVTAEGDYVVAAWERPEGVNNGAT